MIPAQLILLAGLLTGVGAGLAAARSGWPRPESIWAALVSALLIVAWRIVANLLSLNEDFGPLVSVGDAGCLLAGAVGPALVAVIRRPFPNWWQPALVAGLLGFAVNVVIL